MKKLFTIIICTVFLVSNYISAQEKRNEDDAANNPANQKVKEEEPVEVLNSEPFYYCALEMTGDYSRHPEAYTALYREISKQGLDLQDLPAGVYWNNPQNTSVEELKWELGIIASPDLKVQEPLKMKKWDYLLVVRKRYAGSYNTEEESNAIKQVYSWIAGNGYIPDGPLVRRFLSQPARNEMGDWSGKSEIIIPVKKK